jgi:hypothetical protein
VVVVVVVVLVVVVVVVLVVVVLVVVVVVVVVVVTEHGIGNKSQVDTLENVGGFMHPQLQQLVVMFVHPPLPFPLHIQVPVQTPHGGIVVVVGA